MYSACWLSCVRRAPGFSFDADSPMPMATAMGELSRKCDDADADVDVEGAAGYGMPMPAFYRPLSRHSTHSDSPPPSASLDGARGAHLQLCSRSQGSSGGASDDQCDERADSAPALEIADGGAVAVESADPPIAPPAFSGGRHSQAFFPDSLPASNCLPVKVE